MSAAIETNTRGFAANVAILAELLEDAAELGEVHSVFITPDSAALEPNAPSQFARAAIVAKWAQRFGVNLRILVTINVTKVKCHMTYRGVPVTVDTSLYGADAWELAKRLQLSLDHDDALDLNPDQLLTAIGEGGEQQ